MWKNEEKAIILYKKNSKKGIFKLTNFNFLPESVKLNYIKKNIKETGKKYSIEVKNYNNRKKIYETSVSIFLWTDSGIIETMPEKPKPPNFIKEFLNKHSFKLLIKKNFQEKLLIENGTNWARHHR
jgi:hypothetical protein